MPTFRTGTRGNTAARGIATSAVGVEAVIAEISVASHLVGTADLALVDLPEAALKAVAVEMTDVVAAATVTAGPTAVMTVAHVPSTTKDRSQYQASR